MRLKFKNKTDFIQNFVNRADKGENMIVGLGTSCKRDADGVPMYSTGTYVTGYFYNSNNGKFYDSFVIQTCYGDENSAEMVIKRIREVTNIFCK